MERTLTTLLTNLSPTDSDLGNAIYEDITKSVPGVDPADAARLALAGAGDLVAGITADKKRVLRRLTSRAFLEGWSEDELADRIKASVGLDERGVNAVENFRRGLVGGGTPKGVARQRANDYAKRLRETRARTIARTELAALTADAKRQMWEQWRKDGKIDQYAVRVWHTHKDERMCPVCQPMNGQRAAIGRPYTKGMSGPPVHPNCRCHETLERGPVVLGKARDGDGDGFINDGKPGMRPAPRRIPPPPQLVAARAVVNAPPKNGDLVKPEMVDFTYEPNLPKAQGKYGPGSRVVAWVNYDGGSDAGGKKGKSRPVLIMGYVKGSKNLLAVMPFTTKPGPGRFALTVPVGQLRPEVQSLAQYGKLIVIDVADLTDKRDRVWGKDRFDKYVMRIKNAHSVRKEDEVDKALPKDGDGDGRVFDGTRRERPISPFEAAEIERQMRRGTELRRQEHRAGLAQGPLNAVNNRLAAEQEAQRAQTKKPKVSLHEIAVAYDALRSKGKPTPEESKAFFTSLGMNNEQIAEWRGYLSGITRRIDFTKRLDGATWRNHEKQQQAINYFDKYLPEDQLIMVYHGTTPENAASLVETGVVAETGERDNKLGGRTAGLYIAPTYEDALTYGDVVVVFAVPKWMIVASDEARGYTPGRALMNSSAGAVIEPGRRLKEPEILGGGVVKEQKLDIAFKYRHLVR